MPNAQFAALLILEQPQASGTREALMEQPQALEQAARLSCGPCIVCWQEILSPSHYPLERAQRIWNSHSLWNAQSANGTAAGFGTPEGLMERAKCLPPYSKMCELCELCELFFVKKLLSKTECAILTDCALFTL